MKILQVSFQDKRHMTGGQGVSTLNRCRALLKKGHDVDYLSLRIQGEPEAEVVSCKEGKIPLRRITVSDSDTIETPYAGSEEDQIYRREEFFDKARVFIDNHYNSDTVVHLNGFYIVPLLAGALPNHNVCSTYNVLLTSRMDSVSQRDMYEAIKTLELTSFYANRKIHAMTPLLKQEIVGAGLLRRDDRKVLADVADSMGIELHDLHSGLEGRVQVIPHGITDEFFSSPFGEQTDRVVAWGRVSQEKGFEYLIDAAARFLDTEFLIFGTLDDTERNRHDYHGLLKSKAGPNVTLDFRKGGIRDAELLEYIDSASLVVMPSLYETFGLVNAEALARGKPVITTNNSGASYIMEGAHPGIRPYGFVLNNENSTLSCDIGDSIEAFFAMTESERELMSAAALDRAQEFRTSNMIDRMVNLYERH